MKHPQNLFQPLTKPKVSEDLLKDPKIKAMLQTPKNNTSI